MIVTTITPGSPMTNRNDTTRDRRVGTDGLVGSNYRTWSRWIYRDPHISSRLEVCESSKRVKDDQVNDWSDPSTWHCYGIYRLSVDDGVMRTISISIEAERRCGAEYMVENTSFRDRTNTYRLCSVSNSSTYRNAIIFSRYARLLRVIYFGG